MSATIGAAAITAGAGLLGSLFGAKKQDKNAQADIVTGKQIGRAHV